MIRHGVPPDKLTYVLHHAPKELERRDTDGRTPLELAIRFGNVDVVRSLIESGARTDSKNSDGENALHQAVRAGSQLIVEIVVEDLKGSSPASVVARNARGMTPLAIAMKYHDGSGRGEELVKAILGSGVEQRAEDRCQLERFALGSELTHNYTISLNHTMCNESSLAKELEQLYGE